jgi:LacI family transcriptional regulator
LNRNRPTLSDIASRTGFGTNTVSLALRNSTRISKETREIIQAAARELDYVPNYVAKSLALDRTHTVGLILHEIDNPLLTLAAKSIQLELAARGYSVMFATSNDSFEEEQRAVDMLRRHLVDGILIYPIIHDRLEHLIELRNKNFPVVLLIGAKDVPIDAVGIDEYAGAFAATQHLIDLGHRRIGALAPQVNLEKFRGYAAALRRAKIRLDRSIVRDPLNTIAGAVAMTGEIMRSDSPPTAIFAGSDVQALGVLHWARTNRVPVPARLSVAGFDDIAAAKFAAVPLTTIRNDVETTARRAVERLCALIKAPGALPPPVTEFVGGELIVRHSTRRPFAARPVTKQRPREASSVSGRATGGPERSGAASGQ